MVFKKNSRILWIKTKLFSSTKRQSRRKKKNPPPKRTNLLIQKIPRNQQKRQKILQKKSNINNKKSSPLKKISLKAKIKLWFTSHKNTNKSNKQMSLKTQSKKNPNKIYCTLSSKKTWKIKKLTKNQRLSNNPRNRIKMYKIDINSINLIKLPF